MKVISIRQPWATLIAEGYKEYEFRSWATKYRGPILIHASKTVEKENLARFEHLGLEYPTGKIIAVGHLVDCIKMSRQFEIELIELNVCVYGAVNNREGYAFKMHNIKKLEAYMDVNGQLGIWNFFEK